MLWNVSVPFFCLCECIGSNGWFFYSYIFTLLKFINLYSILFDSPSNFSIYLSKMPGFIFRNASQYIGWIVWINIILKRRRRSKPFPFAFTWSLSLCQSLFPLIVQNAYLPVLFATHIFRINTNRNTHAHTHISLIPYP